MSSISSKVMPLRPRREPKPDIRRLDDELLAAEVRGARVSMGVLATGALRSR
jgi:hypothetical protein